MSVINKTRIIAAGILKQYISLRKRSEKESAYADHPNTISADSHSFISFRVSFIL